MYRVLFQVQGPFPVKGSFSSYWVLFQVRWGPFPGTGPFFRFRVLSQVQSPFLGSGSFSSYRVLCLVQGPFSIFSKIMALFHVHSCFSGSGSFSRYRVLFQGYTWSFLFQVQGLVQVQGPFPKTGSCFRYLHGPFPIVDIALPLSGTGSYSR